MNRWPRIRAFVVLSAIVATGWVAAFTGFLLLQAISSSIPLLAVAGLWLRGLPFAVGTGAVTGLGFVALLRALRPKNGFGALGLLRVAVIGFAASLVSYVSIVELFFHRFVLAATPLGLTIFVGTLGSAVAVGLVTVARRGRELPSPTTDGDAKLLATE